MVQSNTDTIKIAHLSVTVKPHLTAASIRPWLFQLARVLQSNKLILLLKQYVWLVFTLMRDHCKVNQ